MDGQAALGDGRAEGFVAFDESDEDFGAAGDQLFGDFVCDRDRDSERKM